MKQLLEALGPGAQTILVYEAPPSFLLLLAARPVTRRIVAVSRSARRLRRCGAALRKKRLSSRVTLLRAVAEGAPFEPKSFHAVIFTAGLPGSVEPRATLEAARSLLGPRGALMVVSRLNEGPLGQVGSLVARAARKQRFPRAIELTATLLSAGLRNVRQATLPRTAIPTVLTWAAVRPRPWEETDEPSAMSEPGEEPSAMSDGLGAPNESP